ncbi:MAG TPA: hypothetical protein VKD70_06595 [Candidatus Acidoferrum sp.]|nr:hypothetical protein [Candidatus Acidoferrum sp.]
MRITLRIALCFGLAFAGGEHFIRVKETILPNGATAAALYEMDHDVGELESTDAKPVERKDLPDISKMDLSLLQAAPPLKE